MTTSHIRSRNAGRTSLRHVWLAGLGLVSLLRREAVNANERALAETRRLQRRAGGLVSEARAQAIAGADTAREQLDPIIARIAPALEMLGLRSLGSYLGRSPLPKKAARRAASGRARRSNRNV